MIKKKLQSNKSFLTIIIITILNSYLIFGSDGMSGMEFYNKEADSPCLIDLPCPDGDDPNFILIGLKPNVSCRSIRREGESLRPYETQGCYSIKNDVESMVTSRISGVACFTLWSDILYIQRDMCDGSFAEP